MIGYVCKYTPYEILETFGLEVSRIDPSFSNFETADTLTHPNMCTYSKAVLEECIGKKYDGIILTSCCDSIRRLYDIIEAKNILNFIYLVDIPRKINGDSINLFKNEIMKLIEYCQEKTGVMFDEDKFKEILNTKKSPGNNTAETSNINIAAAGARIKDSVIDLIEDYGGKVTYNFTCTGEIHKFDIINSTKNIISNYADKLLKSPQSCMRMADIENRNLLFNSGTNIDGVIYHTIKFCDFYSYDYASCITKLKTPILKIETDYSKQSEGQLKTRIEAFIESISSTKRSRYPIDTESEISSADDTHYSSIDLPEKTDIISAGIDSGSQSTNVVIIDSNLNILSYSIVPTGAKSIESAKKALGEAINKAGLSIKDISYIVSTGYGRASIPFSDKHITEITCHARGVNFLNPDIRTIIDIGGQDSKVIRLDENGDVIDFAMNDKCAAGTGRFLEMMARTLEIAVDDMGEESLKFKEDISITSMCTVFAESEVVSLIAQNKSRPDILMGLNNSIASRIMSLLNRIGPMGGYAMTGGVAKNKGVLNAIEKKLNEKIYIPEEPQIVGALGAALEGLKTFK